MQSSLPDRRTPGHPPQRTRWCTALIAVLIFSLTPVVPALAAPSIQTLQAELNRIAGKISRAQTRQAKTEFKIAHLRAEVRTAQRGVMAARVGLAAIARAMYMGVDSVGQPALGNKLNDVEDRLTYAQLVQAHDRDIVQRVIVRGKELRRTEDAMNALLREQQNIVDELKTEQQRLAGLFERARAAFAARQRALRASRAARGSFQVFNGPGPFSVCPVDNPHAYSDDFGAPRYGGGFHRHQGIDLMAPRGTPVRAPFPGTVETGSNGLGGLTVHVRGVRGYEYGAHLSSFAGAHGHVNAGDLIGYVGNTGDAQGGPTHLHFEWHPGNGPAIDSYLYLNQVC